MKNIIIIAIILLVPIALFGQVHFEQNLSWQQIKEKAKQENKYIFVDCYATWCGPCKQMDRDVYPDTALGKFLNPLFVSVKVQMDSTKNDNVKVISWYNDSQKLKINFNVGAYPTFLFFSPNGELVRKGIGERPTLDLLKLALNATNPEKQEYALLNKFRTGELSDYLVPSLIILLEGADDENAAAEVAHSYIHNYLLKLPEQLLYKRDNIILLSKYLRGSDDNAFHVFYQHEDNIDKVSGIPLGSGTGVVENVIINEELLPRLWKDKSHQEPISATPDWSNLHSIVQNKYGKKYADLSIDFERIAYYRNTKQWPQLIDAETTAIERDFFDENGVMIAEKMERLNDILYEHFFFHVNNKGILNKALAWERQIVDKNPQDDGDLDTYANLLYKLGRKKEAIAYEEKAISIKADKVDKIIQQYQDEPANKEYVNDKKKELQDMRDNLQKIKSGKPTWLIVNE